LGTELDHRQLSKKPARDDLQRPVKSSTWLSRQRNVNDAERRLIIVIIIFIVFVARWCLLAEWGQFETAHHDGLVGFGDSSRLGEAPLELDFGLEGLGHHQQPPRPRVETMDRSGLSEDPAIVEDAAVAMMMTTMVATIRQLLAVIFLLEGRCGYCCCETTKTKTVLLPDVVHPHQGIKQIGSDEARLGAHDGHPLRFDNNGNALVAVHHG
jgi:hypothetical protein